jgi:hypothetical protein
MRAAFLVHQRFQGVIMPIKKQLNIQGMHCGGCESIIEEALVDIEALLT